MPQPKSFDSHKPGAVENFVFDCEQYFVGMGIPAEKKVFYASGLLDGSVKSWWRFLCESYGPNRLPELYQWDVFRAHLLARFTAVNATRHVRDQLADFKQTSSVRAYAHKMQDLALQIPNMHDEELLDRFVRGLKPRTRQEVVMREPTSFEKAVQLADRYDSLFMPGFGFNRQPSGSTSVSYRRDPVLTTPADASSSGPVPMEIGAVKRKISPLTPDKRARLLKTGGCFYCRQPGHVLANYPNKNSLQKPRVNNIQTPAGATEQPDLVDEPRDSENSMPQ
jgi:hypothetical protein